MFQDASLVIIGHGSTKNKDSAAPVFQHATELRRRNIFAEVREAFWKQEPFLSQVAAQVVSKRVFFLPLFASEGFFCDNLVPRQLGFSERPAEQGSLPKVRKEKESTWIYCKPPGTYPRMTEILLGRAEAVIRAFPFPRAPAPNQITLFIAGHGTPQDPQSRLSVETQADRIRALGIYAAVHPLFIEEAPFISQWHELAKTPNVVLVPFFMSEGLHAGEDIPALLGIPATVLEARSSQGLPPFRNPTSLKGRRVWYSEVAGTDPQIADLILERVKEAAAHMSAS
jgi:sirohydrochlorin cobaltochelatase